MDKSKNRKIGRPATGKGTLVGVRIQPDQLKLLDDWIARAREHRSRPRAIRQILEQALAPAAPLGPRGKEAVARATSLAEKALDKVVTGNESARPEEQERRKRRLLKGPKEFRDMRADVSRQRGKAK